MEKRPFSRLYMGQNRGKSKVNAEEIWVKFAIICGTDVEKHSTCIGFTLYHWEIGHGIYNHLLKFNQLRVYC